MISSKNIEIPTFQVDARINNTGAIKQSDLSVCQMTADVSRQSGYSNPISLLKTMWHRYKIQSVSHAVCFCRYRGFYSDDSDDSDDLCAQNCVLALQCPSKKHKYNRCLGCPFLFPYYVTFMSLLFSQFSLSPKIRDVVVLSLVFSAGCIFINYLQTIGTLSTPLVSGGFTFARTCVWWPDKTVDLMANKKIIRSCAFIFIVISTSYSDENCKLTFYYV